jgi:hypothetical protein
MMNNLEMIQAYQAKVTDSKTWRAANYDEQWKEYRKLYRDGQAAQMSGNDPTINLVWSTINTAQSAIHPGHAKFSVDPINPEDYVNALILELIINSDWQTHRYSTEALECIKDSLIFGFGVARVDFTNTTVAKDKTLNKSDGFRKASTAMEFEARKGFGFFNTINTRSTSIPLSDPEFENVVMAEGAIVQRVSPFDIYVDRFAKRWHDMRWIAQRSLVPISEAKDNKQWKAAARDSLVGGTAGRNLNFDDDVLSFTKTDSELVEIIEFYDLLEGTYCIFAMTGNEFLVSPRKTLGIFGHPYAIISNEIVPDELYPVGEVHQIASLQKELNETRRDRINRRDNVRPRLLVHKDDITEEGLTALESDSCRTLLVPIDGTAPLSSIVYPMPSPPIPEGTYIENSQIRNDIYEVSGLSDLQRGVSQNLNTATEASLINSGDKGRVARKIEQVERFLEDIVRKSAVLLQMYTTTPRALKVTGIAGLQNSVLQGQGEVIGDNFFFMAGRNAISGPMDINIAVGSVSPRNDETKKKEVQTLLALMAPFVGTVIDPKKLLTHVLRTGYGIQNPSEFFVDPVTGPPGGLGSTQTPGEPNGPNQPSQAVTGPQGASGGNPVSGDGDRAGVAVTSGGVPAGGSGDVAARNQQIN